VAALPNRNAAMQAYRHLAVISLETRGTGFSTVFGDGAPEFNTSDVLQISFSWILQLRIIAKLAFADAHTGVSRGRRPRSSGRLDSVAQGGKEGGTPPGPRDSYPKH